MRKNDTSGNNGDNRGLEVKFYGQESEVTINNVYKFYGVFETIAATSSADEFLMEHDHAGKKTVK